MTEAALKEWVAETRRKFHLADQAQDGRNYWDGYAACLDDVERFATFNERAGLSHDG